MWVSYTTSRKGYKRYLHYVNLQYFREYRCVYFIILYCMFMDVLGQQTLIKYNKIFL